MTEAEDKQVGLSIRFIREWKPDTDRNGSALEAVAMSCFYLGHLFTDKGYCDICGYAGRLAPQPAIVDTDRTK